MKAIEKFQTELDYLLNDYSKEKAVEILNDKYQRIYNYELVELIEKSWEYSYSELKEKSSKLAYKKELLEVARNFQKELLKEMKS